MKPLDVLKAKLAAVTDALAEVGARLPALAQVTVSAGGVTVTVNPKPPEAPKVCPSCGTRKPDVTA